MKQVGIIVGHLVNGPDKGAIAFNGVSESQYNAEVAKAVKAKLGTKGIVAMVYHRDNGGFKAICADMKARKIDMSIELHFNSFSAKSFGCECLALKNDSESIRFSDYLTDVLALRYGQKQRNGDGVLAIGLGGRGYKNLKLIRDTLNKSAPVVLVEPFFGNIDTPEARKFVLNPITYADTLAYAIETWINKNSVSHKAPDPKNIAKSPETVRKCVTGILNKGYGV